MSASTRRWFYLIAGLVAAAIPIFMQLGVIPQDQGDTWLAAVGSLAGGGAALTAAHHTNQQVKSGMHDPPLDPVDTVLQAIPQVMEQQQQAAANVEKLRQAAGTLLVGDTVGQVDNMQSVIDSILGAKP